MTQATMTITLGVLDVLASFVLAWAGLSVTTSFGLRTTEQVWALFRRAVYLGAALDLFSIGVHRLDLQHPVTLPEFVSHAYLVFVVVVFPILRAFNRITQDRFNAVHGTGDSSRAIRRGEPQHGN